MHMINALVIKHNNNFVYKHHMQFAPNFMGVS